LERLKTGKNLVWVAHREQSILHRTKYIAHRNITIIEDGVKIFFAK